MRQRIILKNLQKPKEFKIHDDIEWISNSFGFTAGRDTHKISTQILKYVLKEVAIKGFTTTEKISENLNLTIQRVNYHLRSLVNSGFLYREKRAIYLRQGSVKSAIEEIRKDANRIFDNLSKISEEIDDALGFKNRD